MLDWVSLKASTICFMQGTGASTMSSGSRTAKGSLPTISLAMKDGVAEAERFGLAGEGDLGELRDGACDLEQRGLVLGGERGFELGGPVEVVFHRGLAAAGDDDDLGAAGGYSLFDAVLDERLVDEAEHLFGRGFGGGEEAGAQACGGEHGFADLLEWSHEFLGCSSRCGNASRTM